MRIGEFFASYQLLHQIGSGGAAEVYRARHIHPAYEHAFAIKILHAEMESEKEVMAGFRREAYVLSMLQHPNIVQTLEAGAEAGVFFIAMEFVDGRDLRDLLERRGGAPIPTPIAIHIMAEILKGLHFAHQLEDDGVNLNLVHRDIKPSNILLGFEGTVKVTDFGIATLTGALTYTTPDQVMGTLGYIGPEALAGDEVDCRADVFAAGAIFYEMLCGVAPFDGDTTGILIRNNSKARAVRPRKYNESISSDLQKIMIKALAKNPDKRYSTAQAMLDDLHQFLPDPKGMKLAMSSYCHDIFVDQFVRRMRGGGDKPKAPGHIQICTSPAFKSTLDAATTGHNIRIVAHQGIQELVDSLTPTDLPDIIIFDATLPAASLEHLAACLLRLPRPIPVVATAPDYASNFSATAYRLGALDILVGSPTAARILSSLSLSLRQTPTPPPRENLETDKPRPPSAKLALISADAEIQQRIGGALSEWGYEVDNILSMEAAWQRSTETSHAAIIFDADLASAEQPGPMFVETFRHLPGIGQLPFVYLGGGSKAQPKLPIRCAFRRRDDTPQVIVNGLQEVRNAHHLGRIYTRYDVEITVQFRYGGRAFEALCLNISRGGLRLQSYQLPAMRTVVSLALSLPGETQTLEVRGAVVRTEPPRDSETQPSHLSIAFNIAAAQTERRLLQFITGLDKKQHAEIGDQT